MHASQTDTERERERERERDGRTKSDGVESFEGGTTKLH
jgi:hypothetical protein